MFNGKLPCTLSPVSSLKVDSEYNVDFVEHFERDFFHR